MITTLASEHETQIFAARLAAVIPAGTQIGLNGPLGAGKTTLVRYFVEARGGAEVSSPTYVLQHLYPVKSGMTIEHWDLYRVGALPEELDEPIAKNALRVIEWSEKFPEFHAGLDLRLTFGILEGGRRSVELDGPLLGRLRLP